MKGIIDYLLSDEPNARILRDRFIFKVKQPKLIEISMKTYRISLKIDHSDA